MRSHQHRWRLDFDGTWQAGHLQESVASGRKRNLWPGIPKKNTPADDQLSGRGAQRPSPKWLKPRWDSSMVQHARVPEEALARLMVDRARDQESDPALWGTTSDRYAGQPAPPDGENAEHDGTVGKSVVFQTPPAEVPPAELSYAQLRKSTRGTVRRSTFTAQQARLRDHISAIFAPEHAEESESEGSAHEHVQVDIESLVVRQEWQKLQQLSDRSVVIFGIGRLEALLNLEGVPLFYGENRLDRLRSAFLHEAEAKKKQILGKYALYRAATTDGTSLPPVATSQPGAAASGPEETLRPSAASRRRVAGSKKRRSIAAHLAANGLPATIEIHQGSRAQVSELALSARGRAARRAQLDAAVAMH